MEKKLYNADCVQLMKRIPDNKVNLTITSPPYNLGKDYEKRTGIERYLSNYEQVIAELSRITAADGAVCWQVGTFVDKGEVYPLDILFYTMFKQYGFKLRNRIIWHFGNGLHCQKRLSGRYETVLWFTKSDDYTFNLDAVRVPSKYPNKKHFKGPKKGEISGNPLGKNPADVWDIPNIMNNNAEKTAHPCQFPEALIERLITSMSNPAELVFDPFAGSGTTAVVSYRLGREFIGAELNEGYYEIARQRIKTADKM